MVGLVGLNATPSPGLAALPGYFAPVNQVALQQQAQAFAQPAYAAPVQLPPDQTPDAASVLAGLRSQMRPGAGAQPGAMPNVATPPAGSAPATAPSGPMSFSDMLNHYANLAGARLGQGFSSIPQWFGAPTNRGPMPGFAPVNPAGVLDTRFANAPQGLLGG
jgi:hypothetical protein